MLMLFTSDMKAPLFERGRGAANNAATDSRAERMTAVMHSAVLAPQIPFRLSGDADEARRESEPFTRTFVRALISLSAPRALSIYAFSLIPCVSRRSLMFPCEY